MLSIIKYLQEHEVSSTSDYLGSEDWAPNSGAGFDPEEKAPTKFKKIFKGIKITKDN
jgi:hypothetical protein